MRVAILDGGADGADPGWRASLAEFSRVLGAAGHEVVGHELESLQLLACTGCLDSLVKTPGLCSRPDSFGEVAQSAIGADFLVLASPLRMGFPTASLKTAREVHHRRR